jgi:hypothetical protein
LDVKKRFSEEQIIGFLCEAEAGMPVEYLCRKHCFSEASHYLWRSKFGDMSVPAARARSSGPAPPSHALGSDRTFRLAMLIEQLHSQALALRQPAGVKLRRSQCRSQQGCA